MYEIDLRYISLVCMVNVGKNTSPMDLMRNIIHLNLRYIPYRHGSTAEKDFGPKKYAKNTKPQEVCLGNLSTAD